MSKLLEDLIKQSRTDAAAYELFLKKAEELVNRMAKKDTITGIPSIIQGKAEAVVIFRNLPKILAGEDLVAEESPIEVEARAELALKIDHAVREHAPAGWKGDETRERELLNALFPIMSRDRKATLSVFEIIKNQAGY